MKIVFLFLLIITQNLSAVFEDYVNEKIKDRVDEVVAIGKTIEQPERNQMLSLFEKLQNHIDRHGIDDFWENEEVAPLLKTLMQTADDDQNYRTQLANAVKKTAKLKCHWNKVQVAFFNSIKKEIPDPNIQLPELHDPRMTLDYVKNLLEKNKNISASAYPAIAAGTISLFKVLQDQRNALRSANLID